MTELIDTKAVLARNLRHIERDNVTWCEICHQVVEVQGHSEVCPIGGLVQEIARRQDLEGELAGRALMDAEGEIFLPEVVTQLQGRIEALEKVVKTCPVPDEDGDMDLGAMMNFCERIAALAAGEKKR